MNQRIVAGLLMLAAVSSAQHRVDPRNTYHRVIAVVGWAGSGTPQDPRRPQYAPAPGSALPDGIIAFTQVPTDDGKSAIVEFVAKCRKALLPILADTTITTFEKGTQSASAIEAALKARKADFNLVQFEVVMP